MSQPLGRWPCEAKVNEGVVIPPRLILFMYKLLRDGPLSPGDIEQRLIDVEQVGKDKSVGYTNKHIQGLAEAHAAFLVDR